MIRSGNAPSRQRHLLLNMQSLSKGSINSIFSASPTLLYVLTAKTMLSVQETWKLSFSNYLLNLSPAKSKSGPLRQNWKRQRLTWPAWRRRIVDGKKEIASCLPRSVSCIVSFLFLSLHRVYQYERIDPAEMKALKDEIELLKTQKAEIEQQKAALEASRNEAETSQTSRVCIVNCLEYHPSDHGRSSHWK